MLYLVLCYGRDYIHILTPTSLSVMWLPGGPRECREVLILQAWMAARLPPVPFITGAYTASPTRVVTTLSNTVPPSELMHMAARRGVQPYLTTHRVASLLLETHSHTQPSGSMSDTIMGASHFVTSWFW